MQYGSVKLITQSAHHPDFGCVAAVLTASELLADLIDRLPRLSVELHQQLELDLDNNSQLARRLRTIERQLPLHNAQ
jgi:hypothetical protein